MDFAEGPELIFIVLPSIFGEMPGGYFFGVGFFLLVLIAALTSTVSMIEVPVAYVVDEKHWTRKKAVTVIDMYKNIDEESLLTICFYYFIIRIFAPRMWPSRSARSASFAASSG